MDEKDLDTFARGFRAGSAAALELAESNLQFIRQLPEKWRRESGQTLDDDGLVLAIVNGRPYADKLESLLPEPPK